AATVEATPAAETVEETAATETAETMEETATVRAKVTKTYRDKNAGVVVQAGKIVNLTAERFAELSPRYVKRW
ncbi:MAG: hypothetical protein LUD78_00150, partial [Clostridiales bacterium]|nr:hypothetical protein [Clostridiales bacterium]